MYKIPLLTVALGTLASSAIADDCSSYPLEPGMSVEETAEGTRIISSAIYDVAFDDRSEVIAALRAADLLARAEIAQFMNETIQSDEALNEAVNTEINVVGENRTAVRNTLREQLLSVRSTSEALLRGIRQIGSCYQPSEYVIVSVGVSPSAVASATSLGEMMSPSSSTAVASEQDAETSTALTSSVDGFSNTSGISEFLGQTSSP